MPPDSPSIGMLYMPMFAYYDSAYPGYLHINNDDQSSCAPPFQKSGSTPVQGCLLNVFLGNL